MESVLDRETLAASRRQCVRVPAGLGELLGDKAALGVAINGLEREKNDGYPVDRNV